MIPNRFSRGKSDLKQSWTNHPLKPALPGKTREASWQMGFSWRDCQNVRNSVMSKSKIGQTHVINIYMIIHGCTWFLFMAQSTWIPKAPHWSDHVWYQSSMWKGQFWAIACCFSVFFEGRVWKIGSLKICNFLGRCRMAAGLVFWGVSSSCSLFKPSSLNVLLLISWPCCS